MTVPSLAARATRLVRIASRPYPLSAGALLAAGSSGDLRRLAERKEGLGFNSQILRIAYLVWLFRATCCTHFMETGTYKGLTSLAALRLFGAPVRTVEARMSAYLSSLLIATIAQARDVRLERGDSARALAKWLAPLEPGARPMVYLDAHWLEENPLRRELAAVVARGNSVVVIDDCRVESDAGFGFDSASTFTIELRAIADLLPPERVVTLQPAHPSSVETGDRRGTAILLVDVDVPPKDGSYASRLYARVAPPLVKAVSLEH